MAKALFLDRDGVINRDKNYLYKSEDVEFVPGIFDVMAAAQLMGYKIIVVTNQSGIGRGYFSEEAFQRLTAWMSHHCLKRGVTVSKVYHCPHTPDEDCLCRKPKPGMLLQAKDEQDIDMAASWMIGDKASDLEAAKAAGVPNLVLIKNNQYPLAKNEESYQVIETLVECIPLLQKSG